MCSKIFPIAALAACAALACGGAPDTREDGENELRRALFRVQIHEAELERHRAALALPDRGCDRACPELDGLCARSGSICAIARELLDRDLLARCESSDRSCRAELQRLSGKCRCAKEPDPAGGDEETNAGDAEETGGADD